jgi:hypothetical protein
MRHGRTGPRDSARCLHESRARRCARRRGERVGQPEQGRTGEAKQKGIDLKIIVLDQSPPIDTPLRDIATQVGKAYPGSTVLVISPGWAGTYSPVYDRVTLEAGQDVAKTPDAVQSSKNFVSELTTQHFPWTPFSIVLVLAVIAAVVGTRMLQVRGKRAAAAERTSDTAD